MAYENIIVDTDGPVGIITLNRPKAMNALNGAIVEEIGQALDGYPALSLLVSVVVTTALVALLYFPLKRKYQEHSAAA